MALESKPLFHPEVIRQQVRAFNLPERVADWQPKQVDGKIADAVRGRFQKGKEQFMMQPTPA